MISVIPIRADGSKRPVVRWEEFQRRIASEEEQARWPRGSGRAAVCGKVSGGLEVIDFDAAGIFAEWCELVPSGLLARLPQVKTPREGGRHVYLRSAKPEGNQRLARDFGGKILIETRGERGYVIIPGSPLECHETRRPYTYANGLGIDDAPIISPEERELLLSAARSLNRYVEPARVAGPRAERDGTRPGDDFSARVSWEEILEPHGWQVVSRRSDGATEWRRPGKDRGGASATTGFCSRDGQDFLYVFSTNGLPFESGRAYSRFAAYAVLSHGGDFREAARELSDKGYVADEPDEAPEYEPYPVEALPGPLCRFVVEVSESIGCDVSYAALPAVTLAAAAIGNSRVLRLKASWYEPAVIWSAVVGESGTAKSPAMDAALYVLRRLERQARKEFAARLEVYEAEMARRKGKKNIADPEPPAPAEKRYAVGDVTLAALAIELEKTCRGLLVARDELSGWIGSYDQFHAGHSDAAAWLEMWRAGPLRVDRKVAGGAYTPRAAVSVTGGIQPRILARQLGEEHVEDGLLARLLLACPPRQVPGWRDRDVSPESRDAYGEMIEKLYQLEGDIVDDDGETEPRVVSLSVEGHAAIRQWVDTWASERADLTGELAAAGAKLEAYAARLSLVIHLVRQVSGETGSEEVGGDDVEAGVRLARWHWSQVIRVYRDLRQREDARERDELIAWISSRGGEVTVRELMHGGPAQYRSSTTTAKAALHELVGAGLGEWVDRQGARGPATRAFRMNQE